MATLLEFKQPTPLGERLVAHGEISSGQLAHALAIQSQEGSRLGDILIAQDYISYLTLYQHVAQQEELPFINLLQTTPDVSLLTHENCDDYLQLRVLPWKQLDGIMHIALCEMTAEAMSWIRHRYGRDVQLYITSPVDIRRIVEKTFSSALQDDSCLALWRKHPQASARVTLYPKQKTILLAVVMFAAYFALLHPALFILGMILMYHVTYSISMLFKCLVFKKRPQTDERIWQQRLLTLHESALPIYTVLIPMYREAESLPQMLSAMHAMDYPASKLDIKLVLEADDHETLQAARNLRPSYRFDIICVPPGKPRTKPKACNYALRFARGEYVTIYDADDKPDPLQLKKAVWQFTNAPEHTVCLQARLNYYNAHDNMLTRFFALEYHILFDYLLFGLERCHIPIPLGGTSNHIHLARLRELGEWDPYNVTEDADLGIRITARGLRTQMLDSLTMEEAPVTIGAWLKQRSRWIKGYMQTWLVHMRAPITLYRTLGKRGFWGMQLFIGLSSFVFLSVPVVLGLSIIWWCVPEPFSASPALHIMAQATGALTYLNLLLYIISQWWFTLTSAHTSPHTGLRRAALLYPTYLMLHSLASYKALWQLIVKPHYWEKTMHGLHRRAAKNRASA